MEHKRLNFNTNDQVDEEIRANSKILTLGSALLPLAAAKRGIRVTRNLLLGLVSRLP
jgi:hypothetical protein